jgi:glyoxylase-like metal-dependent hydrolase (beta-lactamase superfamily II)
MDDYGTGRCDFPKGSASQMFDSVQKLYRLADSTKMYPGHDYPPSTRSWRYETTLGASKDHNPQLSSTTTKEQFIALREARDRELAAPRLLFASVQVNVDAGRMPPVKNGKRYLTTPINLFRPADDLGEPLGPQSKLQSEHQTSESRAK